MAFFVGPNPFGVAKISPMSLIAAAGIGGFAALGWDISQSFCRRFSSYQRNP